jgi:hypothetical protein
MSQSDYIKYKRVGSILKLEADTAKHQLLPVLSGQEYIDYKQYDIETNVVNSITLYNESKNLDTQNIIFGMTMTRTNCPTFKLCTNTNERSNRVPLSEIYITPRPVAKYTKHPSWEKNPCDSCTEPIPEPG